MKFDHAPLGKLVQGSVLDVAKAPLERMLKDYDPQLYLKWNPKKIKGRGTWELRRRNPTKEVVDIVEYHGGSYVVLGWGENNFVNHIKDFECLNYGIIDWLKAHDTWNKGIAAHNVAAQAERNLDAKIEADAAKAKADMAYNLKQYKQEWRQLKDYVLQVGNSPSDIAAVWNKATKR